MNNLENIKAQSQKTLFVVEHEKTFYVATDPKELESLEKTPLEFTIRRLLVSDVRRETYMMVLGLDRFNRLASRNARGAQEALAAVDDSKPRPGDSLSDEDWTVLAEREAKREVLTQGLVAPTYAELSAISTIYDPVLIHLITYFSEEGGQFPKMKKWRSEQPSVS